MQTNTMKSLRLTALSLATAVLFGCGGSDGTSGAAGTAQGASTVAVSETASALRVSVSGGADSSSAQTVLAQMQYTFSASVTTGTDAGKTITGTLMLKTEQEDGATEVEGLLIPTTAAAPTTGTTTDTTAAQADALRQELKTKLGELRTAYRADIEVMLQTLRAAIERAVASDGRKVFSPSRSMCACVSMMPGITTRPASFTTSMRARALVPPTLISNRGVPVASYSLPMGWPSPVKLR